jgi:hypothetical protein
MMTAQMAQYAAIFGGMGGRDDRDRGSNPIALLATIILAPLAAMLIQAAISRSREFAADASGAQIAGNPYGLADALRKIEAVSKRVPLDANPATAHMFIMKPFSGAGMMALFSTHPPTEDRIRALLGGIRSEGGTARLPHCGFPATNESFPLPCNQLAQTQPVTVAAAHELLCTTTAIRRCRWRAQWKISTFRRTNWPTRPNAWSIARSRRPGAASTRS